MVSAYIQYEEVMKMMNRITVQPEELLLCAGTMEQRNEEYERDCLSLFQTVEEMGTVWQGEDNAAFTGRIAEFEKDFREIQALCARYAQFLRNAAHSYEAAQSRIIQQAGLLRRG